MKKIAKFLMLALVMCCAFVFTACGEGALDTEVKVDTGNEADYVACAADTSFVTKLQAGEITTPETVGGIKMTLKANMAVEQGEMPMAVSIDFNLMITVNAEEGEEIATEDIGLGAKGSITISSSMLEEPMEMKISAYVKDGVMYINYTMGEEEIKGKMTLDEEESGAEMPEFDITQIEGMINSMMESQDLVEKVLENTNNETYLLELGTTKLYVVVKDGKFNKALITMEDVNFAELMVGIAPELAEGEIPELTFDEVSLAFEFTNSAISYPSFDGYDEIIDGLIPGM